MKCAYCGKEAKGTREHIISCAILDLFPECYITFDDARHTSHESDPMVKDMCVQIVIIIKYLILTVMQKILFHDILDKSTMKMIV